MTPEAIMRAQLAYTAATIEATLPWMDSDDGIDYLWAALRLSEEMVGAWRDGREQPLEEYLRSLAADEVLSSGTLEGEPLVSVLDANYASDGPCIELLEWVEDQRA
jgi:hypothetical protein